MPLAKNGECLINKDPHQPAAEGAFVFEPRRIPRCSRPAVFNSIASSFGTAENTACDEVEQPVTPRESRIKNGGRFF